MTTTQKNRELHQCNNVLQGVYDLKKSGSFSRLLARATRSCQLYKLAFSKDIEKDIQIVKELCLTCWHSLKKQNHLLYWSQCTSKRSESKQQKYKHFMLQQEKSAEFL